MGISSVGFVCNNREAKVRAAAMHNELRRSRSKIHDNKLLTRLLRLDSVESLLKSPGNLKQYRINQLNRQFRSIKDLSDDLFKINERL